MTAVLRCDGDEVSRTGTVEVASDGELVVLHVTGDLDDVAGRLLVDLADCAVAEAVRGLAIDLRGVEAFSSVGAAAIAACAVIGRPLPAGVQYRYGARGAPVLFAAASCSLDDRNSCA